MTQAQAARKALVLLNGLVITLARRRPAKFPAYAADGALEQARIARIHLSKLVDIYEKYQGPAVEPATDRVGEAVEA